ncbi:helix-turn-helix domain-containing protein [Streptomyces sp. MK37H]|uniref:helix-turn-helix domain-containing protein n=1 Tax=Streptomyces sp. MK37H TaxID=2699117 RepID=UPI0027E3D506|nr:helix-turn-helix domain-containing protein [Streptomyces sp. MK37H]
MLRGWLRKRTASQALVLRSRIVLACAEGRANAQVALDLGVSRETVRKWRARFLADRLEGLVDRPRSGAPRKITDEQVEALVHPAYVVVTQCADCGEAPRSPTLRLADRSRRILGFNGCPRHGGRGGGSPSRRGGG